VTATTPATSTFCGTCLRRFRYATPAESAARAKAHVEAGCDGSGGSEIAPPSPPATAKRHSKAKPRG
jgi:hypothetical protein